MEENVINIKVPLSIVLLFFILSLVRFIYIVADLTGILVCYGE